LVCSLIVEPYVLCFSASEMQVYYEWNVFEVLEFFFMQLVLVPML